MSCVAIADLGASAWTSEAPEARATEIHDYLESLDMPRRRLTEAQLDELTTRVVSRPDLWSDLVVDDAEERWWLVLNSAANYEVRVMTWERDQSTDWHDHGGSSGAFAVISGVLREGRRDTDGVDVEWRRLEPGDHHAFDASFIHDVLHEQGSPAVSIHAYSPPLTVLTYYDRTPFGFVAREILPDDRRAGEHRARLPRSDG